MVADFENIRLQVDPLIKKSTLRSYTGVASEEHSKRAILQDERDGVVVDRILTRNERK